MEALDGTPGVAVVREPVPSSVPRTTTLRLTAALAALCALHAVQLLLSLMYTVGWSNGARGFWGLNGVGALLATATLSGIAAAGFYARRDPTVPSVLALVADAINVLMVVGLSRQIWHYDGSPLLVLQNLVWPVASAVLVVKLLTVAGRERALAGPPPG